ncbi:MAG TPA: HAD-IA family hydrolase [Methylophilaceae bacterium]
MSELILFDLDGTLVDTAPDLGLALNLQRERHGLPPLPQEKIRPYASHGSRGLLEIGFGLVPADASFAQMRHEYLALYDEVFMRSPVLFEGIAELLLEIENKGWRWGVVTNKPRRFSEPLLAVIKLDTRAACLVCGDDASRVKPHPDTLLMACAQTETQPIDCMYVGDAERDIQAGRAAGMRTVVALYGYIDVSDKPLEWGADALINSPVELMSLL